MEQIARGGVSLHHSRLINQLSIAPKNSIIGYFNQDNRLNGPVMRLS